MSARTWLVAVVLSVPAVAAAELKPSVVDIKPFRAELVVLVDGVGNAVVVKPFFRRKGVPDQPARVFFGVPGKTLYEQSNEGRSANGTGWTVATFAPRVSGVRPGVLSRLKDGTYTRTCEGKDDAKLTEVSGARANTILDKSTFMTEFMMRRAHMLGRDDSGVYYYVDRFANKYGAKGFRVFVGKKGAMKQLALTDVASDTAGDVFSTKTGDLRLTRNVDADGRNLAVWIRGSRHQPLTSLDVYANSVLIWGELGIYKFLGTLCDNI